MDHRKTDWKLVAKIAVISFTVLMVGRSIYGSIFHPVISDHTSTDEGTTKHVADNMALVKPLLDARYGKKMEAFNLTTDQKFVGIDNVTVLMQDGTTVTLKWNEDRKQLFP